MSQAAVSSPGLGTSPVHSASGSSRGGWFRMGRCQQRRAALGPLTVQTRSRLACAESFVSQGISQTVGCGSASQHCQRVVSPGERSEAHPHPSHRIRRDGAPVALKGTRRAARNAAGTPTLRPTTTRSRRPPAGPRQCPRPASAGRARPGARRSTRLPPKGEPHAGTVRSSSICPASSSRLRDAAEPEAALPSREATASVFMTSLTSRGCGCSER
jgi:hypothetical protein